MMTERGWLKEVDADLRKGEPLWRETGDGHGTTLVATEAGLEAIGVEPVVAQATTVARKARTQKAAPSASENPAQRAGTKQAQVIEMLQRPDGASIKEIVAVTAWLPHTARGVISSALKKRLGLPVTSQKEQGRGTVYRLPSA
jgi:hypothetical protein